MFSYSYNEKKKDEIERLVDLWDGIKSLELYFKKFCKDESSDAMQSSLMHSMKHFDPSGNKIAYLKTLAREIKKTERKYLLVEDICEVSDRSNGGSLVQKSQDFAEAIVDDMYTEECREKKLLKVLLLYVERCLDFFEALESEEVEAKYFPAYMKRGVYAAAEENHQWLLEKCKELNETHREVIEKFLMYREDSDSKLTYKLVTEKTEGVTEDLLEELAYKESKGLISKEREEELERKAKEKEERAKELEKAKEELEELREGSPSEEELELAHTKVFELSLLEEEEISYEAELKEYDWVAADYKLLANTKEDRVYYVGLKESYKGETEKEIKERIGNLLKAKKKLKEKESKRKSYIRELKEEIRELSEEEREAQRKEMYQEVVSKNMEEQKKRRAGLQAVVEVVEKPEEKRVGNKEKDLGISRYIKEGKTELETLKSIKLEKILEENSEVVAERILRELPMPKVDLSSLEVDVDEEYYEVVMLEGAKVKYLGEVSAEEKEKQAKKRKYVYVDYRSYKDKMEELLDEIKPAGATNYVNELKLEVGGETLIRTLGGSVMLESEVPRENIIQIMLDELVTNIVKQTNMTHITTGSSKMHFITSVSKTPDFKKVRVNGLDIDLVIEKNMLLANR